MLIIDEPELLLVPSEKNGVPSILDLDHFKCYEAEGDPLNMSVSLLDQFGEVDCCEANGTPGCDDPDCQAPVCAADPFCCDVTWDSICAAAAADLCGDLCVAPEFLVGESELFCDSVNKDDLGILDPEAELTCYGIEEGDDDDDDDNDVEREVFVSNQFGEQILEIGESKLLCVPSERPCPCFTLEEIDIEVAELDSSFCDSGPGALSLVGFRPGTLEFWVATACDEASFCGTNLCELLDQESGFGSFEFDITDVELDACEAILLESQMLAENNCPPVEPDF